MRCALQVAWTMTLVLPLAACDQPAPAVKPAPPIVTTVVLKEEPLVLASELPGRIAPYAVSEVRPQVSGLVQKRLFTEGAMVKAGEALYQIDAAPFEAAHAGAEATLLSARAKAERASRLLALNAIAPQAHDDAQAAWKRADAEARMAAIRLRYTRVLAPISGRISASQVTQGALVDANQREPLAVISALDPVYVDITQSSSEVLALTRAAAAGRMDADAPLTAVVTLKLPDGSLYPHPGKLQFTDVTVHPGTGAVRLRALFPNPDGLLLPGLTVRALVQHGVDARGLLAPQHGVARDENAQPFVMVVDRKNVAHKRLIRIGRAVSGRWQVLEGLKPGERMVVEGLQKTKPDMKVTPVPDKKA
jgi:membrane fusion protein (multidrug efflux system)